MSLTSLREFVDTNQPVAFQSALGNKVYLHVYGGEGVLDAKLSAWEWVNQPNLKWYVSSSNYKGTFYIESAINRDLVLHQHGATGENGAPCTLWSKKEAPLAGNLLIRLIPLADGTWLLQFLHSNKFAHVHGGYPVNDALITQWEWADSLNLRWRIVPVL